RVTPWLSHIRSYSSRCCTSPPLPWSPGQPAVSPSFPTRRSSALAGIHNVILAQGPQIFFALDVEALDLIEHIGFQQGSYICLDGDRKSTRLNSSHVSTSYAVFCLKNKTAKRTTEPQTWDRGDSTT